MFRPPVELSLGEAYLRHGDEFARRLMGDFAILVLDALIAAALANGAPKKREFQGTTIYDFEPSGGDDED